MKTEFEAEVREAFATRAGRLPVGAASRLRAIDYGPREHRIRTPAIGAGALVGAATAGTALAVVLGGSTPAYAGWSATPTTAAAPSSSADASCQSQLSEAPRGPAGTSLGSGAWQSVLTDVRGPFTVAALPERRCVRRVLHQPVVHRDQRAFFFAGERWSAVGKSSSVHSGSGRRRGGLWRVGPAADQSVVVLEGTSSGDLKPGRRESPQRRRARVRTP